MADDEKKQVYRDLLRRMLQIIRGRQSLQSWCDVVYVEKTYHTEQIIPNKYASQYAFQNACVYM